MTNIETAETFPDNIRMDPYPTDDLFTLRLRSAFATFRAGYEEGIANAETWIDRVAFVVENNRSGISLKMGDFRTNDPAILDTAPSDAPYARLASKHHTLTSGLERDVINDGDWSVYAFHGRQLGALCAAHGDQLAATILVKNEACLFDSKPVFGPHKSIHAREFTNDLTKPLTVASYMAAVDMMAANQDASGVGLGVCPTVMLVPPSGSANARDVLAKVAEMNAAPDVQRHYPVPEIIEAPEIEDGSGAVCLIDASHKIKPIVHYKRSTYQIGGDLKSPNIFDKIEHRIGTDIRDAVAVYDPMLIARIMPAPRKVRKPAKKRLPRPTKEALARQAADAQRTAELNRAYRLYLERLANMSPGCTTHIDASTSDVDVYAIALTGSHTVLNRTAFHAIVQCALL